MIAKLANNSQIITLPLFYSANDIVLCIREKGVILLGEIERNICFVPSMETVDKPTALILCNLLNGYGVENIVVSPGSRCAPVVVALARSCKFNMTTIIDERSAAFVGLGMALRSEQPVALVCTSGSAVLNYAPAIAEAYYRRVPLIVVSADRPYDMIDQRDSQTIRQADVLSAIVRKAVDIEDRRDERYFAYANRLINECFIAATEQIPGPVHINMRFDVPLTTMCELGKRNLGHRIHLLTETPKPQLTALMNTISRDTKVLVVAGDMHPSERLKNLLTADNTPWLLYAEVQSNIPATYLPNSVIAFIENNMPDVVVSIGGSIVSAKMKLYLRSHKELRHISVGFDYNIVDTYSAISDIVECSPEYFFDELQKRLAVNSNWTGCDKRVIEKPNDIFDELAAAFAGADFHFSNGSSIRYAQYMKGMSRVDCNRGVSGIEGSTSTAIGAAMVSEKTTVLVTGDVSTAYDISALAINNIPPRFKMVVLDNNGGDIFRAVATTKDLPEREMYFTTPPRLPLKQLAEAYGFLYYETSAMQPDISDFVACTNRPAILKVKLEQESSKIII